MLSRRRLFALGAAASISSPFIASPVEAAPHVRGRMHPSHYERSVSLHNIHTGESLNIIYWQDGHYIPSSLRELNHLLRDHYSGDVHVMDPNVIDLLAALQYRLGTHQPFQIVSGYRSPHTNAWLASMTDGVAQNSLHMVGKAVDISLEGVSVHRVGGAARSLRAGGVGQYPDSGFVHVDTGRIRYW